MRKLFAGMDHIPENDLETVAAERFRHDEVKLAGCECFAVLLQPVDRPVVSASETVSRKREIQRNRLIRNEFRDCFPFRRESGSGEKGENRVFQRSRHFIFKFEAERKRGFVPQNDGSGETGQNRNLRFRL